MAAEEEVSLHFLHFGLQTPNLHQFSSEAEKGKQVDTYLYFSSEASQEK